MIEIKNCDNCKWQIYGTCGNPSSSLYEENIDCIKDRICSYFEVYEKIDDEEPVESNYVLLKKVGTVKANVIDEISAALKKDYIVFVFPNDKGEYELYVVERGEI